METLSFLPVSVYEFTCDNEALIERIASMVETTPTRKNMHNEISEEDLFYDAELYEWLNSCIGEAKDKLNIPKDVNLEITSCWSNKAKKLQMHHEHRHPNSFMSGILYLSDGSVSGGKTEFTTYHPWWNNGFDWVFFKGETGEKKTIRQQYVPKKGKLLLFPSWVDHKVTAVTDKSTRYTIAFNTFFSGFIADGSNRNRLELKSKSVADHYET